VKAVAVTGEHTTPAVTTLAIFRIPTAKPLSINFGHFAADMSDM